MAAGCTYQPEPYIESNLRMDLWAACALIPGREPDADDSGRLILSAEDVEWVVLCGDSDDRGFAFYPADTPRGTYGGNGCLIRLADRKVLCVPFEYPYDD